MAKYLVTKLTIDGDATGAVNALTAAKGGLTDLAKSAAGVAASAAAIGAVTSQAIDFEEAMADVAKVANGTEEQLGALASRLKVLSTELPLSAGELAKMAAAGAQLGVPIEQLEKFIQVAAKMATAFGISADEAGNSMAKMMNIFGLSLDQVERLGDAINVLGNTTAARESAIIDFLVRVGGSAKQFGLTAEEVSALGTALISMGTAPEVAANGINALLAKLQTANVQGEEFKTTLAGLGISAAQLADDIRGDPQAALNEFLKTLEALDKQSRAEVLTKLFGLEYQDDIAKLVGSLGLYKDALASVGDGANVSGAMTEEFKKRLETTAAQIDILKNSVEVMAINLGTVFLPAINAVITPLSDAAQGIAEFADKNPEIAGLAMSIGTAAASVGALKLAFTGLDKLAKVGTEEFALFKSAVSDTETAFGKLSLAMAGLSAGVVGWEIGTWASENFAIVRKAGVLMVEVMVRGFEDMQFRWESFKAVFTDDTIEAATGRHLQRLENFKTTFLDMYKDAEEGPKKLAVVIDKAGASGKQAGAQIAQGLKDAAPVIIDLETAYKNVTELIRVKQQVTSAENSLAQTGINLAIEQQKTIYEVAKAHGNSAAATAAKNKIVDLEIQLAKLEAQAAIATAEAALEEAKAKLAVADAGGKNVEVENAAVRAAEISLQVAQKKSEITNEVAARTKQLANESDNAANSINTLGASMASATGDAYGLADGLDAVTAAEQHLADVQQKALANRAAGSTQTMEEMFPGWAFLNDTQKKAATERYNEGLRIFAQGGNAQQIFLDLKREIQAIADAIIKPSGQWTGLSGLGNTASGGSSAGGSTGGTSGSSGGTTGSATGMSGSASRAASSGITLNVHLNGGAMLGTADDLARALKPALDKINRFYK